MMNNKTLFVTSFYSYLNNTVLGGRVGRYHHYMNSLKTLLNMNEDIVVYTSENEKVEIERVLGGIPNFNRLKIIIYDLFSHPNHEYFQQKLQGRTEDRCYEIMHGKTKWLLNHINDGYDYIYWIDCGLSHGGLFPPKYSSGTNSFEDYFYCSLFNPLMVQNLNKLGEKIVLLYGDQKYHVFESRASELFFRKPYIEHNCHVVGGLFGGKVEIVKVFCEMYDQIINEMISYDCLEKEEHLLTVMFKRNPELYNCLEFTTWHHESTDLAQYNHDNDVPFYKIFEKLNNII